jgi:hypothetical protein
MVVRAELGVPAGAMPPYAGNCAKKIHQNICELLPKFLNICLSGPLQVTFLASSLMVVIHY